jgi:hypothetical protein
MRKRTDINTASGHNFHALTAANEALPLEIDCIVLVVDDDQITLPKRNAITNSYAQTYKAPH